MRDDKWVPSPERTTNDFDNSTWNPPTEAVSCPRGCSTISLKTFTRGLGTWTKD